MLSAIQEFLQQSIQSLEWVMIFLIIGGGSYLVIHSRGVPLLKIKEGILTSFSQRGEYWNIPFSGAQCSNRRDRRPGEYLWSSHCYSYGWPWSVGMDVGDRINWIND